MSDCNRFVGKNKTKADLNVRSGLTRPRGEEQRDEIVTHVKEFEEWANPNFNVLVVETPRPSFLNSPALKAFAVTLQETKELLKSIARFGLPETSVRNKCPHWRNDQSPLPTNASIPLQRALTVMALGPPPSHKHQHQHAHPTAMGFNLGMHPILGGAKQHHASSSPSSQKFLFTEDAALIFTAALNLTVWWIIGSPPKPRPVK